MKSRRLLFPSPQAPMRSPHPSRPAASRLEKRKLTGVQNIRPHRPSPPSPSPSPPPPKIRKLYVLGSWSLYVVVSGLFFSFHHCILSFFFLRVCFVFTSRSLGSCFFLWSPYSVFVQGVFFVLSGLGSLFV